MTAVIATDGSSCAQVALDLARAMPWPKGSVVHVVTVLEPLIVPVVPGGEVAYTGPQDPDDVTIRAAAAEMEAFARPLREVPARVETAVLTGRPASAIVELAEAVAADLILVGSRGNGTIGSMVLGSVSAEVADHAHCPVLVARRTTWRDAIVGVDGSACARTAEDVVAEWPLFDNVRIQVVSVAESGLSWPTTLALTGYPASVDYPGTERAVVADHRRVADEAAARLRDAGRSAEARVVEGDAATALLRVASETPADVVVVGTRGQTGLRRLLSGSVARNVLLHASCSVMFVREVRPLT